MIVADTDVLVDALRGRGAAQRIRVELATGRLATTVVSVFELLSGARTDAERERVENLVGAIAKLPIDEASAREAADIARELSARGAPIGPADSLIAGVCRARGATLLTRNRAHFERVPGLKLGSLTE